ncbi:MAG: polysulfide reductase NrfD [Desulfitobacterium hafniense]|nr:polysulfide reductase NrfD [Desulfitobacterium hafniense]
MTVQNIWHGLVIWYLFLAGTGAGVYLLAVGNKMFRKQDALVKMGYIWGPILVALGTILLLLDLGRPFWAFLAVLRPHASMISVGTLILTFFMLNGFFQIYSLLFKKKEPPHALDIIGFILAIGTATYTGLLLGVVEAIPFWNKPILLPILFLVSALSSGIGFLLLVSILNKNSKEETKSNLHRMMKFDIWLILIELALLILLLWLSARGNPAAAASVQILTSGFFALPFWGLLIVTGLLLPLVLETLVRSHKQSILALCSIALLIGGVTLRYSIVVAGVWLPMSK